MKRLVEDFPNDPRIDTLIDDAIAKNEDAIRNYDTLELSHNLPEIYYKMPPEHSAAFKEQVRVEGIAKALESLKQTNPGLISSLEGINPEKFWLPQLNHMKNDLRVIKEQRAAR